MKRGGRLRHRSKKRERLYRHRRALVADLLERFPACQRCDMFPSVDVHEVKSRARGGSIVDEPNLRCLCRFCHDEITRSPSLAADEGWSIHSWEGIA